jgi:hypothetical protein
MEQTREPILASDAAKLLSKAAGLTQTALASDMGKVVKTAIKAGPDGLMQQLTQAAQTHVPDPLAQLRTLVAEQGQHFEALRGSIAQIGQSLAGVNSEAHDAGRQHHVALFNAQAEAIQGLTLLAIKGQQTQAALVKALEQAGSAKSEPHPMQKWIYYMVGFSMLWSMLGMIF